MMLKNLLKITIYSLIVLFLLGCIGYLVEDVSPYRESTDKELNIFDRAIKNINVSLCYVLDPKAKKLRHYDFDYQDKAFPLRNECIFQIAVQTKNPQLCENIVNIEKTDTKDIDRLKNKYPEMNVATVEEQFEAYKEACIDGASK